MNLFKIALLVAGAILLSVSLFGKAEAEEEPKIFINEVMWQGSSTSIADEWVELYNASDEEIKINGYSLCAPLESDPNILPESDLKKCSWSVPIGDVRIAGKSFLLISNYDKGEKSTLNINPDVINNDISLSNSKLKIELIDNSGNVVDTAGDGSSSFLASFKKPFPKAFYSLQRINYRKTPGNVSVSWRLSDESIHLNNSLDDQVANYGTPKAPTTNKISDFLIGDKSFKLNSTKTISFSFDVNDLDDNLLQVAISAEAGEIKYKKNLVHGEVDFTLPFSSNCWKMNFEFFDQKGLSENISVELSCYSINKDIYFSEILSAPKDFFWYCVGSADRYDEWFELKNDSSSDTSLTGWRVCDKDKNCSELFGQINSKEFKVYFYRDFKFLLNNDGEQLYLYDPSGELIDSVEIPGLSYNRTFAKFGKIWEKSAKPTPGQANLRVLEQGANLGKASNCSPNNQQISFSEILSAPKDVDWDKNGEKNSRDEWFELYNSSQTDCDLSGWYVLDESGKKYIFDQSIKKGRYLVFFPSKTKISPKISLNNSGESLYLYDPSGKLVSQVKIPSLAYNISYSFIDGKWYKTSKPTPNAQNIKDEEEAPEVGSSANGKKTTTLSSTTANRSSIGKAESVVTKKVIVRKISYNNASVYLKRKNEALVPKMDGAIVLGASSERRYNPFNPKVFLLYLLAVLLLTSVFTYAFYRRE